MYEMLKGCVTIFAIIPKMWTQKEVVSLGFSLLGYPFLLGLVVLIGLMLKSQQIFENRFEIGCHLP